MERTLHSPDFLWSYRLDNGPHLAVRARPSLSGCVGGFTFLRRAADSSVSPAAISATYASVC